MHQLETRPSDVGAVGWRAGLASALTEHGTTLVIIEGDPSEWSAADPASVRDIPAVTLAVVHCDGGPAPAAAAACDLSVRIGARHAIDRDWQFSGSEGEVREWIAQRSTDLVRAPLALTVLARTLRASEHASISDAIAIESTSYSSLQYGAEHVAWLARRHR